MYKKGPPDLTERPHSFKILRVVRAPTQLISTEWLSSVGTDTKHAVLSPRDFWSRDENTAFSLTKNRLFEASAKHAEFSVFI